MEASSKIPEQYNQKFEYSDLAYKSTIKQFLIYFTDVVNQVIARFHDISIETCDTDWQRAIQTFLKNRMITKSLKLQCERNINCAFNLSVPSERYHELKRETEAASERLKQELLDFQNIGKQLEDTAVRFTSRLFYMCTLVLDIQSFLIYMSAHEKLMKQSFNEITIGNCPFARVSKIFDCNYLVMQLLRWM
jgi:hypothetical protein